MPNTSPLKIGPYVAIAQPYVSMSSMWERFPVLIWETPKYCLIARGRRQWWFGSGRNEQVGETYASGEDRLDGRHAVQRTARLGSDAHGGGRRCQRLAVQPICARHLAR